MAADDYHAARTKGTVSLLIGLALSGMTLLIVFAMPLNAQEDVLQSPDPHLRTLRAQKEALQALALSLSGPILSIMSPDAQALAMLNDAASSGADELRGTTDLLAIYENLQCAPDREMLKPLLRDRFRLYSRMLGFDADKAVIPLGPPSIVKLPETSKTALKLRDDLLSAKHTIEEIAASLD